MKSIHVYFTNVEFCIVCSFTDISVSKHKKDHYKGEKSMCKGQIWKVVTY